MNCYATNVCIIYLENKWKIKISGVFIKKSILIAVFDSFFNKKIGAWLMIGQTMIAMAIMNKQLRTVIKAVLNEWNINAVGVVGV